MATKALAATREAIGNDETYVSSALAFNVQTYLPAVNAGAGTTVAVDAEIRVESTGAGHIEVLTFDGERVGIVKGYSQALFVARAGAAELMQDRWVMQVLAQSPAATIADLSLPDGVIGGDFTLATQADPGMLGAGRIRYRLNGREYDASIAGTHDLTGNNNITQSKWGAWRFMIDAKGVVTVQAPVDTGVVAFNSAQEALLNLSIRAQTANSVEFAYITVTDSDSVFDITTTAVDASGVTVVVHYVRQPRAEAVALNADMSIDLLGGITTDRFAHGTVSPNRQGVLMANIAASAAAGIDFTDADTISTDGLFGGHLIITDLAGTAILSLNATGVAGGAAMTYASAALADAALVLVRARIPALFTQMGTIVVEAGKDSFTYGTDDIAGGAVDSESVVFTSDSAPTLGFDWADQVKTIINGLLSTLDNTGITKVE